MASVDLSGAAEVPRHRIKPNASVWFRDRRRRNTCDDFAIIATRQKTIVRTRTVWPVEIRALAGSLTEPRR
jgi:hypothetical protein